MLKTPFSTDVKYPEDFSGSEAPLGTSSLLLLSAVEKEIEKN